MKRVLLLFTFLLLLLSCQQRDKLISNRYDIALTERELNRWISQFVNSSDYEYNYGLFNQISGKLQGTDNNTLILLLTDYLNSHPEDPYQSYYMLWVALEYERQDALDISKIYLNRLVNNSEDLLIQDQSVHLTALNQLLKLAKSEEEKIPIYESLITRFPDRVNLGQSHYYLARAYEKLGLWDRAYEEYANILDFPGTEIPGLVNGYDWVRQRLSFHNSSKNWTFETRESLIWAIKSAISSKQIHLLTRYQSEDFFVLSWSQKMVDHRENSGMRDLSSYSNANIRYNRDLEFFSNDQEAYLKTWGWSYRVRSWYLYFRKIDYPADPEINGRWEWAGIYLGDPL